MNDQRPVLSLAAGLSPARQALVRWPGENGKLRAQAVPFQEDGAGHEEFLAGKYDTGEFSLANYLALKSRDAPFMAIPVFPIASFATPTFSCRENSSLKEPPADSKVRKSAFPAGSIPPASGRAEFSATNTA